MADSENLQKIKQEYMEALHAMQTGVAYSLRVNASEGDIKHIRVGINSALNSIGALTFLLIEKGLITEEEYMIKLLKMTKDEVKEYEKKLSEHYGSNITLG